MKPTGLTVAWNVGSSSLKAVVFRGEKEIERWHADIHTGSLRSTRHRGHADIASIHDAVELIYAATAEQPIHRHIHRIVYGGPLMWKPARVTTSLLHTLEKYSTRDPLHGPAALAVIRQTKYLWPHADGFCVFDSGIYKDLPAVAREYALPRWVVDKYHIRRLGFHGLSHWWAAMSAAARDHKSLQRWSGVTVHLGSGSSITAWANGQPIDTSMGFSPLGGPMMATRSGDLDPLLPLFLIRQAGMTPRRVEQLLEQQSGLFAMSGSADLRDSLSALGHHQHGWPPAKRVSRKQAQLSVDMLTYEVARYIGSYVALVPHVDSIVFTGAIGQNAQIRKNILRWLHHRETWQTYFIPADEERAMVRMVESVV